MDVRTVPASRRMPHFSKAALERSLAADGISYRHMPELGGLRKPRPDSINLGWRNISFRGYADYMQTDQFWEGIGRLLELDSPVIMCAEAVPWRCHRNFVSDELVRRGHEVVHILNFGSRKKHEISPFARDMGDHPEYR